MSDYTAPLIANRSFIKASDQIIVSYDFVDFADGNGIIELYGAQDQTGYLLTKSTFYSDAVETTTTIDVENDATKELDVDFDVTIDRTVTLEGVGYANIPVRPYSATAGASGNCYAIVKLRRVRGGVETDICSGTGTQVRYKQSDGKIYEQDYTTIRKPLELIRFTVPTTTFAVGDTLRVTVEVWAWYSVGNTSSTLRLGHDPANRNYFGGGSEWASTEVLQLKVGLPVRLDL